MADIADLTLETFEPEALLSSRPALVYYYAPWCKACQEVEGDLKAVANEVAERLTVLKVNTDEQGDIVERQRIRTVPSFQIISGGKSISTIQGKPSHKELMEKLNAAVAAFSEETIDETELEGEES